MTATAVHKLALVASLILQRCTDEFHCVTFWGEQAITFAPVVAVVSALSCTFC